ncbi:MAG: extracellular solute-binding protein [Streptosporangiales bacterium]|nr:extracellular solute-binding protein [Streptosporangiales bacterium]
MLRRRLTAFFVAIGLVLAACGPEGPRSESGAELGGKLVISSWGGSFSEATRQSLAQPFGKESGVDIQIVDAPGEHLAQVAAQRKAGKVRWDVIDSLDGPTAALMAKRGLLETLPGDVRTRLQKSTSEDMVLDYGVMQSSIANVLGCNRQKARSCPKSLADFFDTQRFPGPRMMYNAPIDNLYTAWAASGRVPENPTDADVDRAFALLEKIKPSVKVWWSSGDESQQALRSGQAVMGVVWNGRAKQLIDEGLQLDVVWKGAFYGPAYTVVVKDAPNKKAAFAYLEYYASHPAAEAQWAKAVSYGVANPKALDQLPAETARYLPEHPSHVDQLVTPNIDWFTANNDEINKRWKEFLGK